MHAFIAVISTFVLETPPTDFGIVPAAPYVAKQDVDVGSAIHSFIGATSVKREDTDFGNDAAALNVEVQVAAVGSVMHELMDVRSASEEVTFFGRDPDDP